MVVKFKIFNFNTPNVINTLPILYVIIKICLKISHFFHSNQHFKNKFMALLLLISTQTLECAVNMRIKSVKRTMRKKFAVATLSIIEHFLNDCSKSYLWKGNCALGFASNKL